MDTTTVLDTIAERIEQELARVRRFAELARPGNQALASRISRAENILVTHLACRRSRVIRVRVSGAGGRAEKPSFRFLVASLGSEGAVYVVDPASWGCTCPDHHRRGAGCKHALACWALWRVRRSQARPAQGVEGLEHVGESGAVGRAVLPAARLRECAGCGGRFSGRDLHPVPEDHLTFFEGDELCVPGETGCAGDHGVL